MELEKLKQANELKEVIDNLKSLRKHVIGEDLYPFEDNIHALGVPTNKAIKSTYFSDKLLKIIEEEISINKELFKKL